MTDAVCVRTTLSVESVAPYVTVSGVESDAVKVVTPSELVVAGLVTKTECEPPWVKVTLFEGSAFPYTSTRFTVTVEEVDPLALTDVGVAEIVEPDAEVGTGPRGSETGAGGRRQPTRGRRQGIGGRVQSSKNTVRHFDHALNGREFEHEERVPCRTTLNGDGGGRVRHIAPGVFDVDDRLGCKVRAGEPGDRLRCEGQFGGGSRRGGREDAAGSSKSSRVASKYQYPTIPAKLQVWTDTTPS